MAPAGKIRSMDMRLIDDLFEMGGGYVLDFSDKTFAEFFEEEIGVNIDRPKYDAEGTSKAKRLRFFLNTSDTELRIKTLLALWEYRERNRRRNPREETIPDAEHEFKSLIQRLGGQAPTANKAASGPKTLDPIVCKRLLDKLREVSRLARQARGYAYERFLKDLFAWLASRSTAALSYRPRPIYWRPSGQARKWAPPSFPLSTARLRTRLRGHVGCSLAIAGLRPTG